MKRFLATGFLLAIIWMSTPSISYGQFLYNGYQTRFYDGCNWGWDGYSWIRLAADLANVLTTPRYAVYTTGGYPTGSIITNYPGYTVYTTSSQGNYQQSNYTNGQTETEQHLIDKKPPKMPGARMETDDKGKKVIKFPWSTGEPSVDEFHGVTDEDDDILYYVFVWENKEWRCKK